MAEHNLAKAAYLSSALTNSVCHSERSEESPYFARSAPRLLFEGAPRFHEFVLNLPASAEETNAALLKHKIIGGLPLAKWYPELGPNASLWCATELTTRTQIDAVAASLCAITPVFAST